MNDDLLSGAREDGVIADSSESFRKFVAPEIVVGFGARRLVAQYARNLGARRVLVVSDPGVVAAGWTRQILDALGEAGFPYELFDAVTPNPRDSQVSAGVRVYLETRCNAIVAVGGGSPMDCAKAIGVVASCGGDIRDYEGVDEVPNPCPPLICIPTTAGTAADVSQFAIITHLDESRKMAVISKAVVPDVSLTDAETTTTMDAELTADTGMDAFCHAVEALASNAASPLTDLHALEAVRLTSMHLVPAVAMPHDMTHRGGMMLASLHAGLAFSNASLGAVHALAHALGGLLDLAHGRCNAILLPHVIAFNFPAAPAAYARIAEALGIHSAGRTTGEALVGAVRDLHRAVGVTATLGQLGLTQEVIPRVAAAAMRDACLVTNPRRPTVGELEKICAATL